MKNKQFLVKISVVFGLCVFLAILSSLAVFSERELLGKYTWFQFFLLSGVGWFVWIFLSPFILWLGDAFPIDRKNWRRSALIHLFSGLFFALIYIIIRTFIFNWGDSVVDIAQRIKTIFLNHLPNQLFFYWGILGIGHAIKYYSILRDRELKSIRLEKELSDAKLHSLKSQLHPHFLFNTMHTIANLIRDKSYDVSIETISGFSELLRISLDHVDTQFVSLKEEIDYVDMFLKIEKIRFKDRLSSVTKISPEVLSASVPFLLILPFIENSIKHGLVKLEDSQLVHVSAYKDGANLTIKIEDNGPGLPDGWDLEKNSGVGLKNIRKRLSTIYGDNFSLKLQTRRGSGLTAVITVPFYKIAE